MPPTTERGIKYDLSAFIRIVCGEAPFEIPSTDLEVARRSHEFLLTFSQDRIIYGINTGFGPLAQQHVAPEDQERLQYNLIRSHAAGMGDPLPRAVVRAMMFDRAVTFLQGRSGVSLPLIEQLAFFLNEGIHPTIPEHGGVGASGDLTQQAHLGLALIGEGTAEHRGVRGDVADILKKLGRAPLKLKLRDGLAIVNGTACMTGMGLINVHHARHLLDRAIAMGAMLCELAGAYDDHLSAELNATKLHYGQNKVAGAMRGLLAGSTLVRKRDDHWHPDGHGREGDRFNEKVQEHYSIRCIPQILGPISDTIDHAEMVLLNELHSVDDNPIIDHERGSVYHGGNFHGDQVSIEMDKLRLAVVKLSVLIERQLNYLLNDRINERFPAFLNLGRPGTEYGMQGMQYVATSTTAENQAMANSVYVHSIPNNNDNQDVVSMGTNAALMTARALRNTAQVMSVQAIALAQAADIGAFGEGMSVAGMGFHKLVRAQCPVIREDVPQHATLMRVKEKIFLPAWA